MSKSARLKCRHTLCVAVALLFSWGCEPVSAPELIDGVFVLRTVGTNPVPAVTSVTLGTEFSVLADTVTLRTDGSGQWNSTTARRDLGSGASDTTRTTRQFVYSRSGTTVRATNITCDPICDVLPGEAAFVYDGTWLTLGFGPGAQRYERIPPSPSL